MFPLMIPMAIGAAGGLLYNKKDPLKGALLGAGLGAAGGAIAPAIGGLLGTEAAAGATGLGVLDPAQAAQVAAGQGSTIAAAFPGSQPGLMATMKEGLGTASQYAKPIGESAMAAKAVGGLFASPQSTPIQPSPVMQNTGGAQTLASIAQSNAQGLGALQDADMQRRMRQQQMIARMMGRG